jgi:hypothetical protein
MAVSIPNCGTYTVELDFGSTTNAFVLDSALAGVLDGTVYVLDGTTDFQDVTAYVKQVSISRGRQNRFSDSKSGNPSTVTLQIEDSDYSFSLVNEGSQYWNAAKNRLGFEVNSAVRISRNGVYMFTGFITDYKQQIENPNRSLVTISCSDQLFRLQNKQIPGGAVTPERSDLRIDKALTSVGAFSRPGQRILDEGVAFLGSSPIDDSSTVLDYLTRVNTSEQGRLWVDGAGNFHFDRRLLGELQAIEGYFSDVGGTAIPYTTFDIVSK